VKLNMYPKANKIYQHYKGNLYKVLGVAKHSETLEELVIYEPQYKSDSKYWVRPLKMFMEKVELNGQKVPRFKLVKQL